MRRIRASAILIISATATLALACALIFPLAYREWRAWTDQRSYARDFFAVSEPDQKEIVRSVLLASVREPVWCGADGCAVHADYFDRSSALLRTVGTPGPAEPYELQAIRPDGGLVDREFTSAPVALQELLDGLVQVKSFNDDPKIDGLIYVRDNHVLPELGPTRCASDRQGTRLFRISRAAVQQSTGIALVFVTTTFCDGSSNLQVARLKRVRALWEVQEFRFS